MNIYSTEFFANCPNNGIRIKYHLRIESALVIPVEQIIAVVEATDEGFHEEIADDLLARFGGQQTLIADHHGVTIETTRMTHNVQDHRHCAGTDDQQTTRPIAQGPRGSQS